MYIYRIRCGKKKIKIKEKILFLIKYFLVVFSIASIIKANSNYYEKDKLVLFLNDYSC